MCAVCQRKDIIAIDYHGSAIRVGVSEIQRLDVLQTAGKLCGVSPDCTAADDNTVIAAPTHVKHNGIGKKVIRISLDQVIATAADNIFNLEKCI